MSRAMVLAGWISTRLIVVWLLVSPEHWVTGDVTYFDSSLAALAERGLAGTLVEYPLPGVALVAMPWLVADWLGAQGGYAVVLAVFALATDAVFTLLLHRFATREGPARTRAVWGWLLAVPLLGATTYARFDLLPGVLAGIAVLLFASHPRAAASAGALATAVKLWPVLLLPALAARRRSRGGVLTAVAVIGSLAVGSSLVLAGWGRLLSPLTWQQERGLHAESVLATPAMLAWAVGSPESPQGRTGHEVYFSAYNAFEIDGPGVSLLLAASTVLTVAGVLALGLLWVHAWRRGDTLSRDAVAWLCLAAVTVLVTGKVLSPQYLLWLIPAAAAAVATAETEQSLNRLTRWAAVLLLATGLTHVVFPIGYGGIVEHREWSAWVVLALAARNAALVWLAVRALSEAWRQVHLGIALDRQPPGPEGREARTFR